MSISQNNKQTPVVKTAKMKTRPSFQLMSQSDVQGTRYMQMPCWLFSDPRYSEMSLDAKVTYTFLLNRFQLSCKSGWVNEYGEVFVIFPRKALAKELRICEQRISAAFKKLVDLKLVWEKRCGLGDANQIYLVRVTPIEDSNDTSPPVEPADTGVDTGTDSGDNASRVSADQQEQQEVQCQNHQNSQPRTAVSENSEPQDLMTNKKENRKTDLTYPKVSQSICARTKDGQADEEKELRDILDGCELDCFTREAALVFENAIERLFYSDNFRVGNATLPQSCVRARLKRLDGMILRNAENKLHANKDRDVKNSTAYTMSVLFNCIAESESDLMVDSYLNAISSKN